MAAAKKVFYREYRPKTFSDVVGQRHITQTLANEVVTGRVGHAYIFSGSRGTGKTTCAKIFAKAINCPHAAEHNGDPCNECEICTGIDSGLILDVTEMDAASNNGVNDIRALIEECNYPPMAAKYRVYIIDEAHMVTVPAFNAFLKTLEEPPEHVKFILATTDINKIPATILSRCQRFDFRRIEPEDIVERIKYIAQKEGLIISDDAAALIARVSDGALRNAVSTLDQCASLASDIDAKTVMNVTGLTSHTHLFDLMNCVLNSDSAAALSKINELYAASCSMELLCSQLIEHCRNLMVIRAVDDPSDLIIATNDEIRRLREQADEFELSKIIFIQQLLSETGSLMKDSINKRILMETLMVKLCTPSLDNSVESIIMRIDALERANRTAVSTNSAAITSAATNSTGGESEKREAAEPSSKPEYTSNTATIAQRTKDSIDLPPGPVAQWPEILQELRNINMPLYATMPDTRAEVDEESNKIIVLTDRESFGDLLRTNDNSVSLRHAIYNVTGSRQKLGVKMIPPDQESDPLEDFIRKAGSFGISINIK